MVIEGGGEVNLCKLCYKHKSVQQPSIAYADAPSSPLALSIPTISAAVYRGHSQEDMGKEGNSGRCSRKTRKESKVSGNRSHPPKRFWTSQKKCGYRLRSPKQCAMKHGNWESFKEECRKEGKLCEWTFERIREACEMVAMHDFGRLSIAQESPRKHEFLEEDHRTS